MQENTDLRGVGPFQFDLPALSAGESEVFDFRNMERNGRKGWYRPHLPLDVWQVTNRNTDNALTVTVNNRFSDTIVPNAVESDSDAGLTYIEITNSGSTSISAGEVTLTVKKSPYGADDAARKRAEDSWVKRAANDLIPGGLP